MAIQLPRADDGTPIQIQLLRILPKSKEYPRLAVNTVCYMSLISVDTSCDFEDGLCDFVQDESDDMDWNLWSSSTPSLDTGPAFDHTYGNSSGRSIYSWTMLHVGPFLDGKTPNNL